MHEKPRRRHPGRVSQPFLMSRGVPLVLCLLLAAVVLGACTPSPGQPVASAPTAIEIAPLPPTAPPTVTPMPTRSPAPSPTETPTPAPPDTTQPVVSLASLPANVHPDAGLKVVASAADDVGVVWMGLTVDGTLVHQAPESSLRHNLDTRSLSLGAHQLHVEARDAAGNTGAATMAFVLAVGTEVPAATHTSSPTPTRRHTSTSTPTRPTLTPTPTTVVATLPAGVRNPQGLATPAPVSVRWDEIVIDTYAYQQALYLPEEASHPYPLLRRERVGPPSPRTFDVLIVRNEVLELTFLPDLGGRIYQIRFLPTNQTLLYNNPVIKPTHWGPEDQGWWLAIGGIEFCLPVNEHGYVTAEPWTAEVHRDDDGGLTVTMAIQERSRDIGARVSITLRPGESAIRIGSVLANLGTEPADFQYWINAMLSPGARSLRPTTRLFIPATRVKVHSRGDGSLPGEKAWMDWPIFDGRDFSRYSTWRDWLGVFAPELAWPYTAVYDESTLIGIVRVFPSDVARGAKMFGFGQGFGDVAAYTDDGSQYVEMWGGWTPTFWDSDRLEVGAQIGWTESWYVIAGMAGLSLATEDLALYAERVGETVTVNVSSPRSESGTLTIDQDGSTLASLPFDVAPDAPLRRQIGTTGGNPGRALTVRIVDAVGRPLITYDLP